MTLINLSTLNKAPPEPRLHELIESGDILLLESELLTADLKEIDKVASSLQHIVQYNDNNNNNNNNNQK